MKFFENYVINPNTILLTAEIDQKGRVYTKVIEGDHTFVVTKRPKAVLDYSLNYYCSSLKGAWDGSRSILGDINMCPIMINSQLDICWFPCFSPNRTECLWLAQIHVIRTEKISINQTKVYLSFGQSIVVNMKKERFDNKQQRAAQLRYVHTKRQNTPATFFLESKKGFQLIKEPGKGYYNIDFNKKE